jgi:hypothetical protein
MGNDIQVKLKRALSLYPGLSKGDLFLSLTTYDGPTPSRPETALEIQARKFSRVEQVLNSSNIQNG